MTTETKIRLHTFHDSVAISTESTKQLYLTPEDALALATELRRYAKGIQNKVWYSTRNIENGIARNESDNQKKPKII